METINFDYFQKVDLRVASVIEAETIDVSDKLIKLKISLGDEERQIVAGLQSYYQPEDLVGRQIVVVANLAPRKMMGYESQGMLLAASNGEPVLLQPEKEVQAGARIH